LFQRLKGLQENEMRTALVKKELLLASAVKNVVPT